MYIPVLLPTPYTISIIDKNLIYGDVFINPSDLGKNIKATMINNVGEISLEYCIKTILKNNKNVVFHTIQYSPQKRQICFYTDIEINTENWQEKEVKDYPPISGKENITKTVLSALDNELIFDQDCASVFEILMIYRNLDKKIKETKEHYINIIRNKLNQNIDSDLYCGIHDFDFEKRTLSFYCTTRYMSGSQRYLYRKITDNKLEETQIDGYKKYNLMSVISKDLLNLIDFYLSIEDTRTQAKRNIKSVNSALRIAMDQYSIDVYIPSNTYHYSYFPKYEYQIKFYTYTDKIEHDYAFSDILTQLNNREMEFIQKIYVKIDDCPLWLREQLYAKRRQEIIERKHQEELEKIINKNPEQNIDFDGVSINEAEKPKKLSLFKNFLRPKKSIK